MVLFGVDIHPNYQAGISIEEIRREGFDFMACKVSEARTVYNSQDWLRRGKAAGLLCLGYHYLRPGDEDGQAQVFAAQLRAAGVAGMLDAEALGPDGRTPTLTVGGIRTFLSRVQAHGAGVPLLYLPRWYWQRMGSPDLRGLPGLWASSYPSSRVATAVELYQAVTPDRWSSYGGVPVAVLQFASTGQVAGRVIDVDAFLGTRQQFAALIGEPPVPTQKKVSVVIPVQLPRTDPPVGENPPTSAWPTREEVVHLGYIGGWHGRCILRFAVGYPGGHLFRAHVDYPGPRPAYWIDPAADATKGGISVWAPYQQTTEYIFEPPAGSGTLMITYAAPGGASLSLEWER